MFFLLFLELVFFLFLLFFLSLIISYKKEDSVGEVGCYECGFDSIGDSRMMFSYRFFLISILFLIFDVEICLILPLPYVLMSELDFYVFFFMLVLILGLFYEYFNGVLSWV